MANNGPTLGGRKKVCIIGAGPAGMSALYQLANYFGFTTNDVIVIEKQNTWGGQWNFNWLTGTDEYGEPCHASQYRHLWSNGPKECLEYPDYTFEQHFGRPIPSFPPRPVLRAYLDGRWKNSKVALEPYIRFHTVVRNVEYIDKTGEFRVVSVDLNTEKSTVEFFSHVIVATGIFNVPNKPHFDGIETFPGRIIHSHDFRNAEQFKGQRVLVVGASYSAEDMALQCMKFGANSVITCYRTKPMNFKWPKGIEERQLLTKISGRKISFKDGSTAEVDSIILATGYLYNFPFMESRLRLQSSATNRLCMYPDNLYKGTLWLDGGNNKVFYLGVHDQYYSYTMFDAQAVWACRYIMGQLDGEPKPMEEMRADAADWIRRRDKLDTCREDIKYQSEFIADLSKPTGYAPGMTDRACAMFLEWEDHRDADIATYRDQVFRSIFTGNMGVKHTHPWWKALDDSIDAFVPK